MRTTELSAEEFVRKFDPVKINNFLQQFCQDHAEEIDQSQRRKMHHGGYPESRIIRRGPAGPHPLDFLAHPNQRSV